jgi:hypothetical protein
MTGTRRRQSPAPSAPRKLDWLAASRGVYAERMRASTIEKSKYEILKKHALRYGVEPDDDYMRPGNNPAETAVQLLRCGIDMLLVMADNGFPTQDRGLRKKAGKYIRQALFYYGDWGAIIFGQMAPLLYVKMDGRLSGEEPPELTVEHHRKLHQTASSFFPYMKELGITAAVLREFKVLETHELPKEDEETQVVGNLSDRDQPEGDEWDQDKLAEQATPNKPRLSEYAQALQRGENPDDDPALVQKQRDYARDFFIEKATSAALKASLAPQDRKVFARKFVRSFGLEEPDASEFRDRIRNSWIEGCQTYLEYARLDA